MFPTRVVILACLAVLLVEAANSAVSSYNILTIREPHHIPRFDIYDKPVDISSSSLQADNGAASEHSVQIALAYLKSYHGIRAENVELTDVSASRNTGVSYVYARQTVDGLALLNGRANVNIKNGKVISSSQTFVPIQQLRRTVRSSQRGLTARTDQDASVKKALETLGKHLGAGVDEGSLNKIRISASATGDSRNTDRLTIEDIPTSIAVDGVATAQQLIMRTPDGSLAHVWEIALKQTDHRWIARINTATGRIESLTDQLLRSGNYVRRDPVATDEDEETSGSAKSSQSSTLQKRLSYQAIAITHQDPRDGFDFIVNPETSASPDGWVHSTNTSGNNALVFKDVETNVAVETSPGVFAYYHDAAASPSTPSNLGAAMTAAFYVVNSLHDISYIYGFTEGTFNFQDNNYGRGGQANDRITVSVQDSHDTDNADFYAPPDGQHGEMRLFLFTKSRPDRDSALDNSMVSRLFAKGMASRLTGGGSASCFQSQTSSGLLEGWADAVADWLEQTESVSDFTLGSYLENNTFGVRYYPYSRDRTVNPLTFTDGPPSQAPEYIGEVWANMLHNVLAALVDNLGWSNTALVDSTGNLGNVVYMHLLVDGLSIQPCEPTFITARDAIIQADQVRYGGANFCILWRAFAARGLGFGAQEDNVNEYSIPPGC